MGGVWAVLFKMSRFIYCSAQQSVVAAEIAGHRLVAQAQSYIRVYTIVVSGVRYSNIFLFTEDYSGLLVVRYLFQTLHGIKSALFLLCLYHWQYFLTQCSPLHMFYKFFDTGYARAIFKRLKIPVASVHMLAEDVFASYAYYWAHE